MELLKTKTALETKCGRLEKLWETERKGRDVLAHARAQKEKHVCVLLKERDRLEREVKALRRKAETPTPRKMAAPVTPTDLPSPVKMASLSPRPLRVATPSPQKDALELLEGEGTPAKTTPRPARALDLQAAALRKYQSRDAERKKELAKLQARLKRAEAKKAAGPRPRDVDFHVPKASTKVGRVEVDFKKSKCHQKGAGAPF